VRSYRSDLAYSGVTDDAFVVETEVPWRMVSWKKAQYVPCWDVGDAWVTCEWLETASRTSGLNYEVMHDKVCKYSFVKGLEDGQARSVFQWDYCATSIHYKVFDGNCRAVERFVVYPKGYSVRTLTAYPGSATGTHGDPIAWEVLEIIFVNPKGMLPTEYIEEHCATYMNLSGERHEQHWKKENFKPGERSFITGKVLCQEHEGAGEWSEYITRVHLTDRPDVFLVFSRDKRLFPGPSCQACGGEHPTIHLWGDYALWNHWPVYMGLDPQGEHAEKVVKRQDAYERATHTSICSTGPWYSEPLLRDMDVPVGEHGKRVDVWRPEEGSTWYCLFGATDQSDEELKDLARSWLYPACVEVLDESIYTGYDPGEMAYKFIACDSTCRFRLDVRAPLVYPTVVIDNWKKASARVTIDGRPVGQKALRVSVCQNKAVVWVGQRFTKPIEIAIR